MNAPRTSPDLRVIWTPGSPQAWFPILTLQLRAIDAVDMTEMAQRLSKMLKLLDTAVAQGVLRAGDGEKNAAP